MYRSVTIGSESNRVNKVSSSVGSGLTVNYGFFFHHELSKNITRDDTLNIITPE